jgi:hypothetical protein
LLEATGILQSPAHAMTGRKEVYVFREWWVFERQVRQKNMTEDGAEKSDLFPVVCSSTGSPKRPFPHSLLVQRWYL